MRGGGKTRADRSFTWGFLLFGQFELPVGVEGLVDLIEDRPGSVLEHLLGLLLALLVLDPQVFVELAVELALLDADEVLVAEVEEELRALAIGHDLLDGEDGGESDLLEDADEFADVGLLGHLEQDLLAEALGVQQDVRQLWLHQRVGVLLRVVLGVDAPPRRTDDEGVSLERFDSQEVLVDYLYAVHRFVIDLHVLLHHSQLIRLDVVDDVLLEVIAEVNGDASDSAEGLEYLLDPHGLETLLEVFGDCLRDDRVPALLVDGDAHFEAGEEEVTFVEVPVQVLADVVLVLQGLRPVVVQ